jgi:hypothetical protein
MVATSAMRPLADGAEPGVTLDFATDGVRWSGEKEPVVKSVTRFIARCKEARVAINNIITPEEIGDLYHSTDSTFDGEVSNFETN